MKVKTKVTKWIQDYWDNAWCFDVIYYGRNVALFDKLYDGKNFTKQELREMTHNNAWIISRNTSMMWDKPKKALLDGWKRDGRIVMGTYTPKFRRR